jgi:signal peptidase I
MKESIDPLLNGRRTGDDEIVDAEVLQDDPPTGTTDVADGDIIDGDDVLEDDTEETPKRRHRALVDWAVVIVVALLVAFLVRTFVLAHFVVDGTSMYSTLYDNDRVFVNKLSYRLHDPNRGDVVVLHQDSGSGRDLSSRDLIKRVIGLPGENIESRNCQVFIDGQPLDEPYLDPEARNPGSCGEAVTPQTVPEDHVFVMGDNRGGSQDSRTLGPIEEGDLVGRAFVVFWPQSHWQWL